MIIYKYEVSNDLILQYCRIINVIESLPTPALKHERNKIHDEIFKSVGRNISCYKRDDRNFALALSNTVCEIMYPE